MDSPGTRVTGGCEPPSLFRVLGTELWSYTRAASTVHQGATSPAPGLLMYMYE